MKFIRKKSYNLKTKMFFRHGLFGISWFITGLTELFTSKYSEIFRIIPISLMIIILSVIFLSFFMKFENEDEMSIQNEKSAFADTAKIFTILIAIFGLILLCNESWNISLKQACPFMISIFDLLVFVRFFMAERSGE